MTAATAISPMMRPHPCVAIVNDAPKIDWLPFYFHAMFWKKELNYWKKGKTPIFIWK